MKIGVITDVHANLPALEKAVEVLRGENCSKIFHVGDLISIGPYSRECLELALSIPEMEFIMGNHDYWYAFGLPSSNPKWMSKEEVDHQNWTHQQIGSQYRSQVQQWPFFIDFQVDKIKLTFRHYGLNQNKDWFKPIVKNPSAKDMDQIFDDVEADIVFYGHHHPQSEIDGQRRYINVGSAGCHDRSEVRIGILEVEDDIVDFHHKSVQYEDGSLIQEFDKRDVPARDLIRKVFIVRNPFSG